MILRAKGDLCAVLSSTGQRDPSAWPSLCLGAAASIWQPLVFTSSWHSKPTAHHDLPFPGIFSVVPVLPPLGSPLPQRPTTSSSSPQPGLPSFPLSSAGCHWFSTSWEWPELFCLLGRAETRKEGKIIQMSSWIELLKAASSLPQRGHTAKGSEKFGVVSTAGRAGGNGCGWPGRLSQPS